MENLKIYNSVHIRCPLVDVDSLPVVCFEPLKNSVSLLLWNMENGKSAVVPFMYWYYWARAT